MMGPIYAGASHVRIWLGEDTGVEQLDLSVLKGITDIATDAFDESEIRTLRNIEIQKRLLNDPRSVDLE